LSVVLSFLEAAQRRVIALAFMIRWCYIHTYAPV
jgi:hypothetical protein